MASTSPRSAAAKYAEMIGGNEFVMVTRLPVRSSPPKVCAEGSAAEIGDQEIARSCDARPRDIRDHLVKTSASKPDSRSPPHPSQVVGREQLIYVLPGESTGNPPRQPASSPDTRA